MKMFKLVAIHDAKKQNMPVPYDNYFDNIDYGYAVYLFQDDVAIEYIGDDFGEPEDSTLNRDYKWVVDALNEAYANGYKQAQWDIEL